MSNKRTLSYVIISDARSVYMHAVAVLARFANMDVATASRLYRCKVTTLNGTDRWFNVCPLNTVYSVKMLIAKATGDTVAWLTLCARGHHAPLDDTTRLLELGDPTDDSYDLMLMVQRVPGSCVWTYSTGYRIKITPTRTTNGARVLVGGVRRSCHVLSCVDADTGKEEWVYEAGTYCSATTPTLTADGACIFMDSRGIHCVDAKTGKNVWTYETDRWFDTLTLTADGARVLGSSRGKLHCVDAKTGKKVWTYETDSCINTAPTLTADGARVLVSSCYNLHCLDAKTGEEVWKSATDGYINTASTLAADDAHALVGSCAVGESGKLHCFNVNTGKEEWQFATDRCIRTAPTLTANGLNVLVSSQRWGGANLHCVVVKTGATVWTYETGGQIIRTAPTLTANGLHVLVGSCADKHVPFCACWGGATLHCVDAYTGAIAWTYATGSQIIRTTLTPTADGAHVLVCSWDNHLHCLNADTGGPVWTYATGGHINTAPKLSPDGLNVLVSSDHGLDGKLHSVFR